MQDFIYLKADRSAAGGSIDSVVCLFFKDSGALKMGKKTTKN